MVALEAMIVGAPYRPDDYLGKLLKSGSELLGCPFRLEWGHLIVLREYVNHYLIIIEKEPHHPGQPRPYKDPTCAHDKDPIGPMVSTTGQPKEARLRVNPWSLSLGNLR